ncbi:chromosome segregation ATPase [Nocardioides sp. BE266]|uniref:TPM domain-containing protein n=1 Tax=Nocardioides sp. BE266 TaxID=2817725 RepID=UPI0028629A45|nr:TPM domain-containing protein [Nocardioides sp. BE266]MDR7255457.1 chromosome segregation ATPase [Nocardioides sp. BE266]
MTGRLRRAAALAVVACGMALVPSHASAAGDLCDPGVVFDDAGVLDEQAVTRAAKAAFDDRVTVKVIAWQDTPGNVYDAMVAARQECGGWGFRAGGRRSLLVLGVSIADRRQGGHYDGWAFDCFDAARPRIERNAMGPRFGNGEWTEGMVAGLRAYGRAYAATPGTNDPTDDPTGYPTDFPVDPGVGVGSDTTDVQPWALAVPVGLVAAGAGGYGAVRLRRRRKERAAARAALTAAVTDMAQAWFDLDESNELIDARVAALPAVSDSVADAIRSAHAEAVTAREGATATYLELADRHTATSIAKADTDEAQRGAHDVTIATKGLGEARAAMAAVEERLSAYDTLRAELPGRVEGLRAAATDVSSLIVARRSEGYQTTDNDPAPQTAEEGARAVTALVTEQRYGDAAALLERATADLDGHRAWLVGLAAFRAALLDDTAALRARMTALDAAIADAYVTTEGLERDQDPSCVEGIRSTVDRAAADRKALDGALATIERHSSMGDQQFAKAREEITAAQASAESVATDAGAPAAAQEHLRALAVDLPLRAQRAVVEADAIQGQVTTHPAAMTFLAEVPDVSTLRSDASAVGTDVTASKPPYLRLDARLAEAEAGLVRARAVVDRGIADHEAAQRALEGAASAVSAAAGEVSQRDVGGGARALLEEARSLLAEAEAETASLAAITSGADAAKDRAHAAAARARQDQRDAEQRRRAARRAAAAAAASRNNSSSSFGGFGGGSGGGGFSGGGGSSGFGGGGGSGGSGGGGSSSF